MSSYQTLAAALVLPLLSGGGVALADQLPNASAISAFEHAKLVAPRCD